jgi:hypothetical protein
MHFFLPQNLLCIGTSSQYKIRQLKKEGYFFGVILCPLKTFLKFNFYINK